MIKLGYGGHTAVNFY